jgi:hypothetical protein
LEAVIIFFLKSNLAVFKQISHTSGIRQVSYIILEKSGFPTFFVWRPSPFQIATALNFFPSDIRNRGLMATAVNCHEKYLHRLRVGCVPPNHPNGKEARSGAHFGRASIQMSRRRRRQQKRERKGLVLIKLAGQKNFIALICKGRRRAREKGKR